MLSYNRYIQKIKEICKSRNFEIKEIGKSDGKPKLPLYKIIINPEGKTTVCFSSAIHGDETAPSLAILKFLKKFNEKRFVNVKIILFPIANPFGYERGEREGYRGRKLNRLFSERRLQAENKILYGAVKNEDIFFFHALHEDFEEHRFYMYIFGKNEKIYRDIRFIGEKTFGVNTSRIIEDCPAKDGVIMNIHDGSFEDRMSRTAKYSICTETPMLEPLRKRIKSNLRIMDIILNFSNRK